MLQVYLPRNPDDTPRNQLTMVYWRYASDMTHQANSSLPNTINKSSTMDWGILLSVLISYTLDREYLLVGEPFAGVKRSWAKKWNCWSLKEWKIWNTREHNQYFSSREPIQKLVKYVEYLLVLRVHGWSEPWFVMSGWSSPMKNKIYASHQNHKSRAFCLVR